MPTNTDLVKDLPADFDIFGQAVDDRIKALNPETTLGDISYRSATANTNTRLPLGTAGQVLKVNSGATAPEWATDASGMTNPMTTTADIIYSSSGSTPARLGIGTAGQILQVNSGATAPEWVNPVGGGKVLQVVSATTTTEVSSSSTTYADTGLTATITPTSATSKIYVQIMIPYAKQDGNANSRVQLRLDRSGTIIQSWLETGLRTGSSLNMEAMFTVLYMDSPATTSSRTYKLQFRNEVAASGVKVVNGGADGLASIQLLEIGA